MTSETFQKLRPLLFSIAYRMLGSAVEAEDIVQEAYIRYASAPKDEIRSLKSYLSAVVVNLCLDYLKSAQARREQYVGPWLPEPVLTGDGGLTPHESAEQKESLSLAFLLLLERLTPQERAVFLLREVFEYSHEEIATILNLSAANCRQIFHRARQRIADERPRFPVSPDAHRSLADSFLAAASGGERSALVSRLAQEITIWSDSGGKALAARRPIHGRDAVAGFLFGLARLAPPDLRITGAEVNGGPALLIWTGDALDSVWSLHLADGQITAIYAVRNPDKLTFVKQQLRRPGGPTPQGA